MNEGDDGENYILGDEQDGEALENRIFSDDQYFFDLLEQENDLVDRHAAGRLEGSVGTRFEKAAAANPSLAAKAANALALRNFVIAERSEQPAVLQTGFWERLRALFTFSPVPSLVFGGALLAILAGCVFLLVENGRQNAEIARLQSELSNSRSAGREAELAAELSGSKARETELQGEIDEERDISGDLASDLARERENRRRLEKDLANLKKSDIPAGQPREETVSVMRLENDLRTGGDVPQLTAESTTERVSLLISLPPNTDPGSRVSLRLNGREIARNVATRLNASDRPQVSTVIYTRQLAPGENVLTVHDAAGNELTSYKVQGGQPK